MCVCMCVCIIYMGFAIHVCVFDNLIISHISWFKIENAYFYSTKVSNSQSKNLDIIENEKKCNYIMDNDVFDLTSMLNAKHIRKLYSFVI